MRLKTLSELREHFEAPGEFLFVQGEEVTSSWRDEATGTNLPVHVNAMNTGERVGPQQGASVREILAAAVQAIEAEGERNGHPALAHLNHPNFHWGVTWEDLAHVAGERFFEVYNGHRGVRSSGDAEHPSTEEIWDRVNALRVTELDFELLYGVATDDAHSYWAPDQTSIPGRGWVMVAAPELEADALVEALRRGDFYSSSGVRLADVRSDGEECVVEIDLRPNETCTTLFRGARRSEDGVDVGIVFSETHDNPARYTFTGDELFVRAVVVSSRDKVDGYEAGDKECAWTQPVRPAK
jgi:hypothetical protein